MAMSHEFALLVVRGLGLYALVGLLFAPLFVFVRASRIDPDAKAGSLPFRLLILPGAAALWPLLAIDWLRGSKKVREEHNAHRKAVAKTPSGAAS